MNDVKAYYDAWDGEETTVKVEAPEQKVKAVVVSNPERALRKGDNGTPVTNLQKKLIAAGFKLPKYGADGDYGYETVSAVKVFQKAVGITVDGIAGPVTFSKLETYKKPKNKSKSIVAYPGHLIKKGSRGKDVERVQRAVSVSPDGVFGTKTEVAVKAYQKRHGLKVDGLVGRETWNKLF
ncbi:peptidoglycan-binding domain-containing protein [Metabacillus bambusae]|uniref:peptidoglycan-binding domain-containing protein n=1 Tax=Metabacillus bambusae TaxID=2795218 RepID=UPI0027DDCA28|nr:peptidoglycan-binding protein [Metabacillus bambusae]